MPGMTLRSKFIISLALFFIGATLRLWDITSQPIQSDEPHWIMRSRRVVYQLENDPLRATSHLVHPGVTSALVLGAGLKGARIWNDYTDSKFGDSWYLDEFSGARIANGIFSSLLPPLLLLMLLPILGTAPSILAGALTTIAPDHLALSRIAHIDTTLIFFITATFFAFYKSLTTGKIRWKLIAGAFWGLAFAIKPTAIGAIVAILGIKLALWIITKIKKIKAVESIVTWSDIWALIIGHAVFALVYTRTWEHPSEFITKHRVKSYAAKVAYQSGEWLQTHYIFSAALIVILCSALILILRQVKFKPWLHHIGQIVGISLFGIIVSVFNPAIIENILRYWAWTSGLTGVKHEGFVENSVPHPLGYLGLFINFYPAVLTIGLLITIFYLVNNSKRRTISPLEIFATMSIVGAIMWAAPLMTSPKQAWRYFWPMVPFLYGVSTYGIVVALRSLATRFKHGMTIGVSAIILISFIQTLSISSRYEEYRGSFGASVPELTARGFLRPLSGMNEAIDFLMSESIAKKRNLLVMVHGDAIVIPHIAKRRHGKAAKRLHFGQHSPWAAEYLLSTFALPPPLLERYQHDPRLTLVYTSPDDSQATRIWQLPPYDLSDPIRLGATKFPRRTGTPENLALSDQKSVVVLRLIPGVHDKGLVLMIPYRFRIDPRIVTVSLRYFSSASISDVPLSPDFGGDCKFNYSQNREVDAPMRELVYTCNLPDSIEPQLTVRWDGVSAVDLREILIEKNKSITNDDTPSITADTPSQ